MAIRKIWIQRTARAAVWLSLLLLLLLASAFIGQFLSVPTLGSALAGLAVWGALLAATDLKRASLVTAGFILAAGLGYFFQTPSTQRDWKPEIARLPKITYQEDALRIENVRDFSWHSLDSFEENWVQQNFDLNQLTTLDVFVVPFGDSKHLAHVMLSFGFADGRYLALSVETRPEIGERYSLMGGAARQLELIYLFGTERDLLGLRILHRGNRVCRFPLKATQGFVKELFLELCASANQLHEDPKFYATLRHNCTTTLLRHVDRIHDRPIGFRKEILFPAQLGQLLHRLGYLDTDMEWTDAAESFRVDQKITAETDPEAFSHTLRD